MRGSDQSGTFAETSAEARTGGDAENTGTGNIILREGAGQRRALLFLCRFLW